MQNIGIRISQYRQNRNLTQEELAVKIGVTSQAVSKWERGQSLPDIITFSQLCNILDVSADVLLETNSNIICKMCLLSTCHMLHGLHREMSIVIQEIATPSLEHSPGCDC